jgi:hypothetical protein
MSRAAGHVDFTTNHRYLLRVRAVCAGKLWRQSQTSRQLIPRLDAHGY